MAEFKTKAQRIKEDYHCEWSDNLIEWEFFRDAANAHLNHGLKNENNYPKDTKMVKEGIVDKRNVVHAQQKYAKAQRYFVRFPLESEGQYKDRAQFSQDFGLSKTVLLVYVSHIVKAAMRKLVLETTNKSTAGKILEKVGITSESDLEKKMRYDADGKGKSLMQIIAQSSWEMGAVGKSFILLEKNDGMAYPVMCFIKREDLLDWHTEDGYEYVYAKIRRYRDVFDPETLEKSLYEDRIIYTPKYRQVWTLKDGVFVPDEQEPNNLGKVPLFEACMGFEGRSIIEQLANIQMNEMNIDSEMRQIIRNGLVILMVGPVGIETKLSKGMGIGSFLELDNGDRDFEFKAPEAGIIEGHLKYWARLLERSRDISKIQENAGGSDVSAIMVKQINHLDVEAILNFMVTSVENQIKNVVKCYLDWQGKNSESVNFEIDKKFNIKSVQEMIQEALGAKAYGLGELAESKIGKNLRDSIVKLTEEEKEISDEQIQKLHAEMSENDAALLKSMTEEKEYGQGLE